MIRQLGRGILFVLLGGAVVVGLASRIGALRPISHTVRIAGPTHPVEPGRNGGDDDDYAIDMPPAQV